MEAMELFAQGIAALTHADAAKLEMLAEAALNAEFPPGERGRRTARTQHRAFSRLLVLTRRNLRLLRGDYKGGYAAPRG